MPPLPIGFRTSYDPTVVPSVSLTDVPATFANVLAAISMALGSHFQTAWVRQDGFKLDTHVGDCVPALFPILRKATPNQFM